MLWQKDPELMASQGCTDLVPPLLPPKQRVKWQDWGLTVKSGTETAGDLGTLEKGRGKYSGVFT